MPVTPPPGFITRPQASKRYNRSQRQLERDVDDAYLAKNKDVLDHFMVITKDGMEISAENTSTQEVKQMVKDGKVPAWYVAESYLEQKYGKKGSSPPSKQQETTSPVEPTNRDSASLPNGVEFLKERIRTLEREKREEAIRNAEREGKLFDQLSVKDRQISAWDEVSQGLTKALALGKIGPLGLALPNGNNEPSKQKDETIVVEQEGYRTPSGRRPERKTTPKAKRTVTSTKGNRKADTKGTAKTSASKKQPKTASKKPRTWQDKVFGLFHSS